MFDETVVDNLKKRLVQGLTKNDIIISKAVDSNGNVSDIFTIDCPRFINEYQSRLYVNSVNDAINADDSINIDALGEVVSVAVEYYFMFPRSTKKHFPDMYKMVEDALRE